MFGDVRTAQRADDESGQTPDSESSSVTEKQPETIINEENLRDYVLVRTDGKRPLLIEAASSINDALKEIFGYSLKLNNDWLDELGGEKAP